MMTSKERVRRALQHLPVDRIPAHFECTSAVSEKLMKHYGFTTHEEILEKFEIDIRCVDAKYIGTELPKYIDVDGNEVTTDYWGCKNKRVWTGSEYNSITCFHPLDEIETLEGLDNYPWPSADWFDYSIVTEFCQKNADKAIMIGHPGPFQIATFLRNMDKLFVDMALEPEFAQKIYDKMVDFELDYYERMLIAGQGLIDIIRPHDDYGTQISLLFSVDMWRQFFKENTKKLVDLTHKYGAFYQQHSCGAIQPIIPELIACGVDVLEPLQKVNGLEATVLQEMFGGKICFQGGIDTQVILPFGTVEEVIKETEHYMDTLHKEGGYVLMASQYFEGDVPIENIEAVYSVNRIRD